MILLIADSVCGGFGQLDKKSFVHLAIEKINFEILDHSATGMTSSDYLDFLRTGNKVAKEQGDLYQKQTVFSHVIIALGNVDCKGTYSKNNLLAKIIPKRYRKEKLDPRPYYSKKKSNMPFKE